MGLINDVIKVTGEPVNFICILPQVTIQNDILKEFVVHGAYIYTT